MDPVLAALRRPVRRPAPGLALLAGLVLLFGLGATAVHHHEREDGAHACAICSLGHAPAAVSAACAGSAPAARIERVLPAPAIEPRSAGPDSPSTRAPPQS